MKFLKYSLLLVCIASVFTACTYDELKTFDEPANVYFTALRDANAYNDSTLVNFLFLEGNVQQTIINLSVTATGPMSAVDRYVSVTVKEGSTAIEGTHYTIKTPVVIPAGSITGNIEVTLHRTPDLMNPNTPEKLLELLLVPNADFRTDIKKELKRSNSKDTISVLDYKITFSDKIAKPKFWTNDYFGVYSNKKFLLICTLNGVAPAYLDGQKINGKTILPGEAFVYAKITQQYLSQQAIAGTPVYEEDGTTLMTMGVGL